MKPDKTLGLQDVNRFLTNLFDGDLHAKRVLSLAKCHPWRDQNRVPGG